jgi:WD40 repeat protein
VLVTITNDDVGTGATMHVTPVGSPGNRRDLPLGNGVAATANLFGYGLGGGSVAFGDSSEEVAIAFVDGSVEIRSTTTGALLLALSAPGPSSTIPQISFTGTLADGRLAEALGQITRVWDLRRGNATASPDIVTSDDQTRSVAFAALGRRLVTTTVRLGSTPVVTIHVFDKGTHGWIRRRSFAGGVAIPSVSPDGFRLVQADGGRVASYNLENGRVVWGFTATDSWVVWSADGGQLFSSSVRNGKQVMQIRSPKDGSVRLTFQAVRSSGGGTPIAIGRSADRLILVDMVTPDDVTYTTGITNWRIGRANLIAAACNETGRNLTRAEWKQYVGEFDVREKTCTNLPWPEE